MKKRSLLIPLALPLLLLLLVVAVWLSLQSAFVVNHIASLAAPVLGYRIQVQAVSFSPSLRGNITGLVMTPLKGNGPSASIAHVEVKATVKNIFSAEVERLVITGPRLIFRLDAKSEKTDLSALEKLPPVRLLAIQQGEVDISYGETHVKLTGLQADVKNFSPESGGSARFEAAIELSSQGNTSAAGRGRCKGNIDVSGPINNPKARGSAELLVDSASIGVASVQSLSLSSTFDLDAHKIKLEPVNVTIGSLVMTGEQKIDIKGYALDGTVLYEFDSTRIAVEPARGKAPGTGPFTASYYGALNGNVPWKASLDAPSVNFTEFYSQLKPLLPEDYRKWSVQGSGALQMKGEGAADGTWKADVNLTFREGGFKSGDASKAGQRITGNVTLKLRSGPEKKTRFDLALDAGDAELLWGTYYRNFKGERVIVASSGNYSADAEPYLDGSASLDLSGTGQYNVSAQIGDAESLFKATGKNLSHEKLFSLILKDYLKEGDPLLSGIALSGQSDFTLEARMKAGKTFVEGTIRVDETALTIPDFISLQGLTLSLPFDVAYPWEPSAAEPRESKDALLFIKKLQKGSLLLENLEIPFVFSQNSLRLLKSIDARLYGGALVLPRLEAHDLFSAETTFVLAMSLEHLDLGLLTRELTGTEVPGAVNADFSSIAYRRERWITKGGLHADVFGGTVELTNFFAENLLSKGRKTGFDLFFHDIDLEKLTGKIALGKMTGTIKGSVANFMIEYGQPARFFLDVESDPTKKVGQVISVAAVENLSVLGTGTDVVSSVLNSGIHRFFKEYPYSRIGILCTLENDTFSVRGKIHEGGKEYLVRRGWLRGLDVVIQNPDNSISFGDMEERISRIFRPKEQPIKVSQGVEG